MIEWRGGGGGVGEGCQETNKAIFNVFPIDKSTHLICSIGQGPLWKHFCIFCDSVISSKFYLFLCHMGFGTQSSDWNTSLACCPSVFLSEVETVRLTQSNVRPVELDIITLGQLLGSAVLSS